MFCIKSNDEITQKLSLYLHKDSTKNFDDCIKDKSLKLSTVHRVKSDIGLEGRIYVHEPTIKLPSWKATVDSLSIDEISIKESASNKAVVVFKNKSRFMSVTFGYGKSMLEESTIERNFGLIVAANLIDSSKIKSLNSMTLEDTILDSQKQTFIPSTQDKFQIDPNAEILKSIAGSPTLETTAKFLVGTDSLTATRKMDIKDIKESLQYYFDVYQRMDYKKNGFWWLDNIKKVKDSALKTNLDDYLKKDVLSKGTSVVICPNKIMDWESLTGFCFSGNKEVQQSAIELDYRKYLSDIQLKFENGNALNIINKLKRDKIIAFTDNEEVITVSTVYDGIIFETEYGDSRYILCFGEWFEINKDFYSKITGKIRDIPKCDIQFISCKKGMSEGDYNNMIAQSNPDYFLMDKQNFIGEGYGRSRVEPCDILTKDNKFVHVKFGRSSSNLSHLFSQGVVSATIFSSDDEMRKFLNKKVNAKFGSTFIKKSKENRDFEVVYAIIDDRDKELIDSIPFFSLVNLAKAFDNLKAMGYQISLMKIDVESR